jgi:hypothetical protein
MNIIAIDPSLSCTAMIVNDHKFIYAKEDYGVSIKTGKLKKWFDLCQPMIQYRWINSIKSINHSDQEILKLVSYDLITDNIIDDIKLHIKDNELTKIGIEGYSYSSSAGPLIDLVTFSTLLRLKLYSQISHNIRVIQPASLKLESCMLTYPPTKKGVKVIKLEYRNHDGIAGGSFKKPEMLKALIDNSNLVCEWVEFLRYNSKDMLELNTIPKPIEDMNDAKLLYEILKNNK